MQREIELAFIKLHILHHAAEEAVFGSGLMEELARHGYQIGPGTLYPTLAKMEALDWIACQARVVEGKQRKYYQITAQGQTALAEARVKLKELYEELIEPPHAAQGETS